MRQTIYILILTFGLLSCNNKTEKKVDKTSTETMFIIEDESHAETQKGEFQTFEDAFSELERRSKIPWNEIPNCCPCTNWKDCGRNYQIIEYDTRQTPWKELKRKGILTISAKEIKWTTDK